MEVYVIPHGEHLSFYRQFGLLNRIEPIQLQTGEWVIPTRVVKHFNLTYVDLEKDQKRFVKRLDCSRSTIIYVKATLSELDAYPKREITEKDIHERYKDVKIQQL